MNNNKTTNILLGIMIVVLIAIGIIMATNQNRNSYRDDINANNFPVIDKRNDIPAPVQGNQTQQAISDNTSKTVNWNSVSISTIEPMFKKSGIFFDSTPTLDQQVDLTGDGIKEGLYGAQAGNGAIELIALANPDGSISLAQMKTKDGKIILAELDGYSSAGTSEGYKVLPEDHGFYRISKSYNEQLDKLACTSDSVDAYQWNSKTNLFEYNSTLTAKYTAIECK